MWYNIVPVCISRAPHIGQLSKVYYVNAEAISNDVTQERVDDYVAAMNGMTNMEQIDAAAEASGISWIQYYNDWYGRTTVGIACTSTW